MTVVVATAVVMVAIVVQMMVDAVMVDVGVANNASNNNCSLVIGGFIPLTTIDFPEHLSAVIFCQGCPFRCVYCHNQSLIPKVSKIDHYYSWQNIYSFLSKRKNILEAVVFSGGEPTLQRELINAVVLVKKLGFKIGLHTAGSYPNRLKELLPYLDWVGMDLKAPFAEYELITKIPNSGKRAFESAKLLIESKVHHEFRTTGYPELLNYNQIKSIVRTLKSIGSNNYRLQKMRSKII